MIEKAVSLRPADGYITDSLGWVSSPLQFFLSLSDSQGTQVPLSIAVPSGTSDGTENFVELTATSQTDDSNSGKAGIFVLNLAAQIP